MECIADKKKMIVKNTVTMYVRMFFVLIVNLYISRIILNVLGVVDYGIYNAVGGVIVMLGFLSTSLSSAGSRFLSYALGEKNNEDVKQIFSTLVVIHLILSFIILILCETVGLWFIYEKLVIPNERFSAAVLLFHFTIITTLIAVITIPYSSTLMAHEKMKVYALISILDVILKLISAILIKYIEYDKLILYAITNSIIQLVLLFFYVAYGKMKLDECKAKIRWYPVWVKKIYTYALWTINGSIAVIGYTQGINILLNMFFGPVVNAARGIAVQVHSGVMAFVHNYQTAVKPQIVKSYAVSDLSFMHNLIIASSKYGFFLILIIIFPLLLTIEYVLSIWLDSVPKYSAEFTSIMLCCALIEPLRGGMISAIHATGDIKKFQILEGTALLSILPIAYILLKFTKISPAGILLMYLVVEFLTQVLRVFLVLPKVKLPFITYFHGVLLPIITVLPFAIFPFFIFRNTVVNTFGTACLIVIVDLVYMTGVIMIMGLKRNERSIVYRAIINRLKCKI